MIEAWNGKSSPLILSLTGGGFRGYFTALVLAKIEETLDAPCHKIFDLIAGTSIGGIIAVSLAYGIPAKTIATTIASQGTKIFPSKRFKMVRRFIGPPYSGVPIQNALKLLMTEKINSPLSQALQHVMIIAAAPGSGRMEVISSWDLQRTATMSVLDAALATSAAPTYFPAHRATLGALSLDLVDGGVAANAPDSVAIHHAVQDLAFPVDQIALLSVGTCSAPQGAAALRAPPRFGVPGTLKHLGGRGIINFIMAIQEDRGIREGSARLQQDRYLRVDRTANNEQAKHLELDNASIETQRTLESLADAAIADLFAQQTHRVWYLLMAKAQAVR